MKYIDADTLRVKITDLCANANFHQQKAIEESDREDFVSSGGEIYAYAKVLSLLDSLQQEQEQYVISGQVFGATDIEQLYKGKVYIVSNLVQDTEFGLSVRDKVKMLLIKD